jgi:demethylmenaquinone methyltransferase / 2-methoxy-6-polyprenyl-1,4-benzoquinol methylase
MDRMTVGERQLNTTALELFAPIASSYDRWARILSLGQDPRWRSFLVGRIDAHVSDVVLDVACGTAAVALELVRRYDCTVVGIDQSAEMLDEARRRVAGADAEDRIELRLGRAEQLPFPDASFDALTFTYLLRYVDDPATTLAELSRVVRPGGRIAGLEFFVPRRAPVRVLWEAYVRLGLPIAGRVVSPGWGSVGRFLGGSIRDFWRLHPLESLLEAWQDAGLVDVDARVLTLGGGIVIWGRRAG